MKMDCKIILHLGLPKTGTTFLQQDVFPKITNVNHITSSLTARLDKNMINIISDEGLSTDATIKGVSPDASLFKYRDNRVEVVKKLSRLYPASKVIIVTRDIKEWKHSLYSENIKHGEFLTFSEWENKLLKVDPDIFNIDLYVKSVNDFFEDILVLRYEELKENHERFIQKICDFIGCPLVEYNNRTRKKKLDNNTLNRWRRYNKYARYIFKSKYSDSGFIRRQFNPSEIYRMLKYR